MSIRVSLPVSDSRSRAQLAEGVGREQIDEAGVPEPMVQERGLAGLAGPVPEQRPVAQLRGKVDDPLVDRHDYAELHVIRHQTAIDGAWWPFVLNLVRPRN